MAERPQRAAPGSASEVVAIAEQVRQGLRAGAQPGKADQMRAYLKSDLPCLGTYSKDRRAAVAAGLDGQALDAVAWEALIRALWDRPSYREERQAAVDVLVHRTARSHRTPATLNLCSDLAVEGAWWDLVDGIGGAVNDILDRHREAATPIIRAWATHADLWVRRLAIISQLRSKAATDVDLLAHAIDANATSREFFLRKAIGWALRSYARTDPAWVRGFVDERRDRLSALSIREATKHL